MIPKSLIISLLGVGWMLATAVNSQSTLNQTCLDELKDESNSQIHEANPILESHTLISGNIFLDDRGNISLRTVWSNGNHETQKIYKLEKSKPVEVQIEQYSPKEIREDGVFVQEKEGELVIYLYNSTVNCSYIVNTSSHFTEVLQDDIFATFSLGPAKDRLLVAGEGIKNESSVWTKYEGEVDRAGNPKIFVINLNNQQIDHVEVPMDHICLY
ncbi:uncharacterized protein LOC111699675 [Eurytemora carolleeae]|uniref:uncharacterized protein LOC111699675 n=1 Tax=Eurytemora carolleeae TaxID=1294199 RepID=UPI000C7628B0|nr:uncharacterized protein LOC111699675 [Eurytemora carolleeae]|eukprot:XP_023326170.1 uncharacterized protein LOC111699675 [Eurytemora affinis]